MANYPFLTGFLFVLNCRLRTSAMFSKKKKKLDISLPKNFEHRVHTGFDKRENRYVGLPPQWAGIVSPTPAASKNNVPFTSRPTPLIDPSEITPTEILDLKVTTARPSACFLGFLPRSGLGYVN